MICVGRDFHCISPTGFSSLLNDCLHPEYDVFIIFQLEIQIVKRFTYNRLSIISFHCATN